MHKLHNKDKEIVRNERLNKKNFKSYKKAIRILILSENTNHTYFEYDQMD